MLKNLRIYVRVPGGAKKTSRTLRNYKSCLLYTSDAADE